QRKLFGFRISLLRNVNTGARFINLRGRAGIAEIGKCPPSFLERLKCLIVSSQFQQNDADIILSASQVTTVICLREMRRRSSVVRQGAVEVLYTAEPSHYNPTLHIIASN